MTAASTADVYQSIKAALDIFKVLAPPTHDVPSKQTLVQAADRVKTDAAKIGLMCSGSTPPADELLSLATALQRSCVAFCTACHAITAVAGPTLKDNLGKLAQNLINPCLGLVKEMSSGKDLKPHVGAVWDGVAAVSKASADNKGCLFAGLAKVMAVLKDTARELEELKQEQQEKYGDPTDDTTAASATPPSESAAEPSSSASTDSPAKDSTTATAAAGLNSINASSSAHSNTQPAATAGEPRPSHSRSQAEAEASPSGSGSDEDDDDDLDFEAGEMSFLERQLLSSSLQLLAASMATLKAFGKVLLQGPTLSSGSEGLDAWESCLWHAKHLRRAAEDLGAAMYPPQDVEEVAGAALAVFEVTELMADECPDPEAVGAVQLTELSTNLTQAHERVQRWLQQAAEQQHSQAEPPSQQG